MNQAEPLATKPHESIKSNFRVQNLKDDIEGSNESKNVEKGTQPASRKNR